MDRKKKNNGREKSALAPPMSKRTAAIAEKGLEKKRKAGSDT